MSMRAYVLNGAEMQTREAMHDTLSKRFDLPAHYGRNLDALWDMLSERGEGGVILLLNEGEMPEELLFSLLGLLTDLTGENTLWKCKVLSKDCAGTDPLVPCPLREQEIAGSTEV